MFIYTYIIYINIGMQLSDSYIERALNIIAFLLSLRCVDINWILHLYIVLALFVSAFIVNSRPVPHSHLANEKYPNIIVKFVFKH